MNKPTPPVETDSDIGPLDENGQQIWSPEEEEAIARMHRDPAYWAAIKEAEADIAVGRLFTHEEMLARSAERRRKFLAERNR